MSDTILYPIALVANIAWFGMAFRYFGFQHRAAAKLMVPRSARNSPLFETVAAGTRFLGGMNGALALLSVILLVAALRDAPLFTEAPERALLLTVFASAHLSQFAFNLPVLRAGGRIGESYWPVLSGPMLFIFVVDAAMTVLNAGIAALVGL